MLFVQCLGQILSSTQIAITKIYSIDTNVWAPEPGPLKVAAINTGGGVIMLHPEVTGDWKTRALKTEVWVEAVTEGGRRFMAAWREEEDAARYRQEKREATRLGKLQSHTEA